MSYRPLNMGQRKHVNSVLGSGTIKCRYYLFCQKFYTKRKSFFKSKSQIETWIRKMLQTCCDHW